MLVHNPDLTSCATDIAVHSQIALTGATGSLIICLCCPCATHLTDCHRPVDANGNLLKGVRKVAKPRKAQRSALGPRKPTTKVAGAPATERKGVRASTTMQVHAPGASAMTGSAAAGEEWSLDCAWQLLAAGVCRMCGL